MAERGLSSHRRKRRKRRIRLTTGFLLFFLLSYILVSVFLLDVVRVSDESMAPGIREGDVLLASPIVHIIPGLRPVRRGDIVLLENPGMRDRRLTGHLAMRALHVLTAGRVRSGAPGGGAFLPRRVIALPGDRLLLENYRFYLYREGDWVRERELLPPGFSPRLPEGGEGPIPWVGLNTPGSPDQGAQTVPEGMVYLAADNRGGPQDSRIWGAQPVERLHGHLFLRIFPVSRFGAVDNPVTE